MGLAPTEAGSLRLGVLLDTPTPPRWKRLVLEGALGTSLHGADGPVVVELVLLGLLQGSRDDRLAFPPGRARNLSLSRRLYDTLDQWRFSSELEILMATTVSDLPGAPPMRSIALQSADGAWRLAGDAAAYVRALGLDLLLVLSDQVAPATVSGCARLGAAGFVLSDHADHGDVADGLPEVLGGEGIVGIRLELFAAGMREPVHVVDSVTNADFYSAVRTRANAARHCVPLFERLVAFLSHGDAGRSSAARRSLCVRRRRSQELLPRRPLAVNLASLALKYATARIGGGSDVQRWEMAYRWTETDASNTHPDLTISHYVGLHPPHDRLWADPFPLRVADRYYVVFEELQFADDRGYVCVMELGPGGPIGDPVIVLDRPYHLSYPFLFEYGGEHYMLPETSLEGRLELYRAVRLPFEWTLDRILIDEIHLIDATLAEIDGRWWLFGCRYIPGLREWNDLMLYHAPSPLGPWTPHSGNPVISDVRWARPAGNLYSLDGSWYRPAQDCARTYGGALTIRRIVRLNEKEYEEEEVARVDPGGRGGIDGLHTLNRLGPMCLIDVKRRHAWRRRDDAQSAGGSRG